MSDIGWDVGVGASPAGAGPKPGPARVAAAVAAVLDRVRARRARRLPGTFLAAAGATDRDLTRLGRLDDPVEVLREAHLIAVSRVGHP